MTTDPEDELAEYPVDRRLTFEETARFWEEKLAKYADPSYQEQKPGMVYRHGDRRYDFFESDEDHADFLVFIRKLRRGEL
jgi:hypothetical protein